MEFFVVLIVVLVLFSLVGGLFRKEQQHAPASRPARPRFRTDYDEPEMFRRGPVNAGVTGVTKEIKPASPASEPAKKASPYESDNAGTAPVAANLQRIFSDSDRLVAGFVFNEILQPHRGVRPRR